MNARSELVIPANPGGETALARTLRFETASPAFMSPALRPTRGSGAGLGCVAGLGVPQAATTATVAKPKRRRTDDITASWGLATGWRSLTRATSRASG